MQDQKPTNEELSDSEVFDKVVEANDDPDTNTQPSAESVERHEAVAQEEVPGREQAAPVTPETTATSGNQPVPPTPVNPAMEHNKGGVIVLQWLTYAFWGWFAAAFTVLAGFVINGLLDGKSDVDVLAYVYPLSAVIVTYLFAIASDFFYHRYEPAVKTGAANVIMLIHAVLYILVAAGAAIGFVFSIISYALNTTASAGNGSLTAVLIATVALVVFGAVAIRVVLGGKKSMVRKTVWIAMSLLTIVVIAAAVVGPIAKSITLKNDRLIEQNLSSVPSLINDYVDANKKLPANLKDVKVTSYNSEEVQRLIDSGLVEYKPGVVQENSSKSSSTKDTTDTTGMIKNYSKELPYQLCVTYQAEKNVDSYNRNYDSPYAGSKGVSYITATSHPKGNVCYDLVANYYDYSAY